MCFLAFVKLHKLHVFSCWSFPTLRGYLNLRMCNQVLDHVVPSQDASHQDDMFHMLRLWNSNLNLHGCHWPGEPHPTYHMDTFSFYELLKTFFFPLGGSECSIRIASHEKILQKTTAVTKSCCWETHPSEHGKHRFVWDTDNASFFKVKSLRLVR